MDVLEKIKNKVIISSQAMPGEPLYEENAMKAMIKSVLNGGAGGLRLAGERDIKNARKMTDLPIIGITKPDKLPENWIERVYITPSREDAKKVVDAGADIVAFDGTSRNRECADTLEDLIAFVRKEQKIAMADISTNDEAINCEKLGFDIVSTTLAGYTKEAQNIDMSSPDWTLLSELTKSLKCPVILEGRIWTPEDVRRAFELGAMQLLSDLLLPEPSLLQKDLLKHRGVSQWIEK